MKAFRVLSKVLIPVFAFYITLVIADYFLYKYRSVLFSPSTDLYTQAPQKINKFDAQLEQLTETELKPFLMAENSRPKLTGTRSVRPVSETILKTSPFQITEAKMYSDLGEPIYSATYTYNSYGRRVNPSNQKLRSDVAVLTIGCSFTLGIGVNDDQTYSHYLQEDTKIPVLNLGLNASFPGDILYDIQFRSPTKYDIKAKKIFIVYGFIKHHLFRNTCDWRCFQPGRNWLASKERYSSLFGKLYLNKFKYWLYNNHLIANFILQFNLVSKEDSPIAFPPTYTESNLNLFNSTLEAIYSELSKKYEIVDSYTVYLNEMGEHENNHLSESLSKADHFKVIKPPYSELAKKHGFDMKSYFIPIDEHPSPLHHYVTGKSIYERIKKDHPSYFN